MKTLRHILVPVDSSDASVGGVDFAVGLAKHVFADLVFCHSVDLSGAVGACNNPYGVMDIEPILEALEGQSKTCLAEAAARALAAGVRSTTAETAGPPAAALLDVLKTHDVDAVVMGSHGRKGWSHFFLGSKTEGIVRRADIPVFVVPDRATAGRVPGTHFARIEVAFDASTPSENALETALGLARPGETSLLIAHIVDIHSVAESATHHHRSRSAALRSERDSAVALVADAAARAKSLGIAAEAIVFDGPVAERVLELARVHDVDLIVIGTHGRRGFDHLILGSVAERVLQGATVPVLVLPATLRSRPIDVASPAPALAAAAAAV